MTVEQPEVKTLLLTGPITLYEVSAVRETLRMALAEGKPLRIDLSDSGPWDLAGLQLIVSCVARARRNRDLEVRLVKVPGCVRRDCRAMRSFGLAGQRSRVIGDTVVPNPTIVMSKTVLHADDSASVRRWVAEQLGEMDLKVISVADGEAALKVLRESPCDLLLTDLEMPNLDGLVAGRGGSRPADASISAGSDPVVPASERVSRGAPAGGDGLAGQADRAGEASAMGPAGLPR